jgi:hypothetical protein
MVRIFLILLLANVLQAKPIEPIVVTEQTLQINGEQRFFFAFETGDEMVLDLSMLKGKFIKEFEILVYKGSTKFQVLKTEGLKRKKIRVFERAVYEFRIKSGGAKRIQFKIERIPYSEARIDFDTYVEWRTITDTIRRNYSEKITTVYDTSYVAKYRKILQRTDIEVVELASQEERVHSRTNLTNANVNTLTFNLPPSIQKELLEQNVIGWAYWIGVGQEGTENYNKELKKFLQLFATRVVAKKNILAGLALGIYSVALNPPKGENIVYQLSVERGGKTAKVASGNITSAFGREMKALEGKVQLTLTNDNFLNGLNVGFKITAVVERKVYRMEGYQVRKVTTLELKDIKGKVLLREREVPVINAW